VNLPLTTAQGLFVDEPGSIYVEACPGAGKTRAIVARFVRRASEEPRKGIALLSFTNAAVDEVALRCAAVPRLLGNPHFVGTFDSFINSFVVGPELASENGRCPRFIDSWESQEVANFFLRGTPPYLTFKLEWFDIFPQEKRAALRSDRVGGTFGQKLLDLYQERAAEIDGEAWKKWWWRVVERGYVSCSASRTIMHTYLAGVVRRERIGRLLRSRFAEVIVDEAQDCGAEELAMLRLVREHGVTVSMVGDLDQSIFEFRDAVPAAVRQFGTELGIGVRMAENFRSTPAICAAVGSLRSGSSRDIASGPNALSDTSVVVFPYAQLSDVAGKVLQVAGTAMVSLSNAIVLSHRASDARQAVQGAGDDTVSTKKCLAVARASMVLRNPFCTSRQRRVALESVRRSLLGLIQGVDPDDDSCDAICEAHSISIRWLDASAYRLSLGPDPRSLGRSGYAQRVRCLVDQLAWPSSVTLRTMGDQVKAPTEAEWDRLVAGTGQPRLTWGTIHSVKGAEFELVCVVIPRHLQKDQSGHTVLDHWEQRIESEPRRVLYVALSRAKGVLALAVHQSHVDQVEAILASEGVPYVGLQTFLGSPGVADDQEFPAVMST
jgi:DNA helicase II / ATP-dependent DNA helicase PcrA